MRRSEAFSSDPRRTGSGESAELARPLLSAEGSSFLGSPASQYSFGGSSGVGNKSVSFAASPSPSMPMGRTDSGSRMGASMSGTGYSYLPPPALTERPSFVSDGSGSNSRLNSNSGFGSGMATPKTTSWQRPPGSGSPNPIGGGGSAYAGFGNRKPSVGQAWPNPLKQSSGTSTPIQPGSNPRLETQNAAELASKRLEGKLQQIQDTIDDFYDDRDLALTGKSEADQAQQTRLLPALTAHIKRVPLVGVQQGGFEQKAKKKAVQQQKPIDSFASLGRILQARGYDKAIFQHDAIICGVSMAGVLLMLINSILAWIPRTPVADPPTAAPINITFLNLTGNLTGNWTLPPTTPVPTLIDPRFLPLRDQLGPTVAASYIILNIVIGVSTLICILFILRYYKFQTDLKRSEWCRLNGLEIMPRSKAYSFWSSSLRWYMLLELLIHVIIPYPWFNPLESPDARYLELFMLLRTYTVFRLLHHRAPLYRFRHDIVRGNRELRSANFQVRFTDTMKVYFYENTLLASALMYATVALIGGFAVFVAERETNNGRDPIPSFPGNGGDPANGKYFGFNSWFEGVYFMVVSIRTIGYGELRPITLVGRALTILFQFTGMSVEAILGSVAINKIAKSQEEKIIDEYLQSFQAWHELRVSASMLIQAAWKTSLRYQYLHQRRIDETNNDDETEEKRKERLRQRKNMERVLRTQRRRREFLHKVVVGGNTFPMPAYTDITNQSKSLQFKNIRVRMESDRSLSALALKQILMHFASASQGTKRSQVSSISSLVQGTGADGTSTGNDIFEKMPFLRKKEVVVGSNELVLQYKKLFTQDVDLARWGKNASQKLPPGFDPIRTFTATKKVVGRFGERRIPIGTGHKANILLQALKIFRSARQNFKATIASSADHVVEAKLLLCYELLTSASRKLKRNNILMEGLKKTATLELDSVENLLTVSLSGGMDAGGTVSRGGFDPAL